MKRDHIVMCGMKPIILMEVFTDRVSRRRDVLRLHYSFSLLKGFLNLIRDGQIFRSS